MCRSPNPKIEGSNPSSGVFSIRVQILAGSITLKNQLTGSSVTCRNSINSENCKILSLLFYFLF